ncbi:M17 family metallopeptidase [Spiroplasma endosymbiont of Anurida maritima]|uniref:M17 family metallopeptidase n=1 Tax=Spiroplasma endosymbiont of Anurida maritima TaxID=2967972 RepID=UPI0036D39F76
MEVLKYENKKYSNLIEFKFNTSTYNTFYSFDIETKNKENLIYEVNICTKNYNKNKNRIIRELRKSFSQFKNKDIILNFENVKELKVIKLIYGAILFAVDTSFVLNKNAIENIDGIEYKTIIKTNNYKELEKMLVEENIKYKYVSNSRYLQDGPPNIIDAECFCNFFIWKLNQNKALKDKIKIKVVEKEELEERGMDLMLSVNKGSSKPMKMLVMEYMGNTKNTIDYALVGKGIIMDSGGYSIKPKWSQIDMKFDMAGASIVANAILGAAELNSNKNIVAIAPLTENLVGPSASLVGDIYKSYNGKFVEITNTDAEGRLVLADAITYAIKEYGPTNIIDIATLTGVVKMAMGANYTGAFSNNEDLYNLFLEKSQEENEDIWRLPLQQECKELLKSNVADLKNATPDLTYGLSVAPAFLEEFIEGNNWLHLDIAGSSALHNKSTGVMVKSIINIIK